MPEDGTMPMLMVYSSCGQFIRTIPDLVMDENNVEDVDTDGEDHIYDEACHMVMARPLSLKVPQAQVSSCDRRIMALEKGEMDDFEHYATIIQEEEMRHLQDYDWDEIEEKCDYDDGKLISTVE